MLNLRAINAYYYYYYYYYYYLLLLLLLLLLLNEVEEITNYNVAARKQTLTGNFSRRTYRRYRKFLELATSPFSNVTKYFYFFVDLRLKLSISDAQATQLC